jgi:hypothetical protein
MDTELEDAGALSDKIKVTLCSGNMPPKTREYEMRRFQSS